MTNAEIIYREQVELMKAGIIGTTGRMFEVVIVNKDGEEEKKMVPEPEPIHTYQMWKSLGYQVQKGQKAVAQFTIWKHASKVVENEDGEEKQKSSMFMKKASFFKLSQVEKIEQGA